MLAKNIKTELEKLQSEFAKDVTEITIDTTGYVYNNTKATVQLTVDVKKVLGKIKLEEELYNNYHELENNQYIKIKLDFKKIYEDNKVMVQNIETVLQDQNIETVLEDEIPDDVELNLDQLSRTMVYWVANFTTDFEFKDSNDLIAMITFYLQELKTKTNLD